MMALPSQRARTITPGAINTERLSSRGEVKGPAFLSNAEDQPLHENPHTRSSRHSSPRALPLFSQLPNRVRHTKPN